MTNLINKLFALIFIAAMMYGCKYPDNQNDAGSVVSEVISDDSLMNLVQYQTFQYFWD